MKKCKSISTEVVLVCLMFIMVILLQVQVALAEDKNGDGIDDDLTKSLRSTVFISSTVLRGYNVLVTGESYIGPTATRIKGLGASVTEAAPSTLTKEMLAQYNVVWISLEGTDDVDNAGKADIIKSYVYNGGGLILEQPNIVITPLCLPYEFMIVDNSYQNECTGTILVPDHYLTQGLTIKDNEIPATYDEVGTIGPEWTVLAIDGDTTDPDPKLSVASYGAGKIIVELGNTSTYDCMCGVCMKDIMIERMIKWVSSTKDDTDGDGMPDDWESSHGLDPNDPTDAVEDPDLDYLTNLREYHEGTDPHNGDTDSDALKDGWEVDGIDINGDSTIELDLPAMGADPLHKDIFVEIDYMIDPGICIFGFCAFGHSHTPKAEALKKIIDAFANAPVNNPDGDTGIRLHVDAGSPSIMNPVTNATWGALSRSEPLTHTASLGSKTPNGDYSWSDFDTIKNQHFSANRSPAFHYCIFAHNLGGFGSTSGISRGIPAGDFIVSLGSWSNSVGTVNEQAGTFMHELGHNLSLRHGGDNHENWKPNFLSIMNYSFQTRGLRINGNDGNMDYSIMDLPNLVENNLNESLGLGADASMNSYGTIFFSGGQQIVNKINDPIDWNNNGLSNEVSVNVDINRDGSQSTLTSYDDWDNLVFNGGSIGEMGIMYIPPDESQVEELTKEEDDTLITSFGVSIDGQGVVHSGVGVSIIRPFTITNIGESDDNYQITATSSKGWSVISTIPSNAHLNSKEEVTFPVTIEVPQTVMLDEEEKLTVTVTSQTNPNVLDSSELLIQVVDNTPPDVSIVFPQTNEALQDGAVLAAEANDTSGVDSVSFYIREPNDGSGVPIGKENLVATLNIVTGKWEYNFDTMQLPDGYYVVLARAVDTYGNEGWSEVVPFSIRNWAIITLLPATPNSKAGRTMPVKFSLRIAAAVDPAMPFVYNDELEIRIYDRAKPGVILQRSVFGSGSTNYRIDMGSEKYITNFKTKTTPATYVVEVWRPAKNFLVGSFTFATTK